jgi:mycothiol synthase
LTGAELVVRPAADDDAGKLAHFINACTLAYQGVTRSSESDVVERLHMQGSAPEDDSFVVSSNGGVVGFAHLWRADGCEIRLFARTHPDALGRSVSTRLLELCEARARALHSEDPEPPGEKRLTTTSWAADTCAPALLEGRGFVAIRHFLKMEIASDEVEDLPPPWPAGLELRPVAEDGSDEQALYEAWLDSFAGHFGPEPSDLAAFWHERRDARREGPFRFDPSLWWVATDPGGHIVGFSLSSESEADGRQVGRVAEIGVRPTWRSRGLGYALLLHSFRNLKKRGATTIVLDVDAENVTSALRLYVKAGMTPQPAFTIWELKLEGRRKPEVAPP